MKSLKSTLLFLLALAVLFQNQSIMYASAAETRFIDVDEGAWYAEAVGFCAENGLMSGTGANTFSPDLPMSRSMLVTVLYRMAGSPVVTGTNGFSDVVQDTWYTNAVIWAAQSGIVSGYGSGLFGTNDPVTREQIATILWNYSGKPSVSDTVTVFSDAAAVSPYAVSAVNWARSIGMINGKPGNLFDPKGGATRAEVATILRNYLSIEQPKES